MDIHKIQKTGNMFYVYLPTSWCKKHGVSSKTKVSLDYGESGSLIVLPRISAKQQKKLHISVKEQNHEVLQKLIIAAYKSPADSFRIDMEKKTNILDLLSERKFISFEPIEIDENAVTCESSMVIGSPISLLNTMVAKIKNMLTILKRTDDRDLVNKYEDEIDKLGVLIEKSVIDALSYRGDSKLSATDLYYVSSIAKNLEQLADYLRFLDKLEKPYLDKVSVVIIQLKDILSTVGNLNHETALSFVKKVLAMPQAQVKNLETYDKRRVRRNFIHIAESLIDWALVKEVEKSK